LHGLQKKEVKKNSNKPMKEIKKTMLDMKQELNKDIEA
jgi:hypothetical protein